MKKVYQFLVDDGLPETDHLSEEFVPIDGDFSSITIIDETDDGGTRPLGGNLNTGRAVDVTGAPSQIRRKGFNANVPIADFIPAPRSATYVSDRAKEIIESFEPGTHQFIPMDVLSRGKVIGRLNFMIIGNRLETLDRELTTPKMLEGSKRWARDFQNLANNKPVFSSSATKEKHLWHDLCIISSRLMSAELKAAFDDASLRGLKDHRGYELV